MRQKALIVCSVRDGNNVVAYGVALQNGGIHIIPKDDMFNNNHAIREYNILNCEINIQNCTITGKNGFKLNDFAININQTDLYGRKYKLTEEQVKNEISMVIFNKIKLRFESLVNKLYRVENVGVLSDKLEVTAALVFGDTGRKVYSKIAKNTLPNERVTGKIVGYEIKNITDSDVFFIDYNLIPGGSYLFTLEQLNYRVTMEDIKCVMSNGVWIKSTGGVDLMYFVPKDRKKLKEVQIVENVKSRWILKKTFH